MSGNRSGEGGRTRRDVLGSVGAASVAGFLGGATSTPAVGDASRTTLGEFESGLDGWRGGTGTELSRVSRADRPAAVSSGRYGLLATVEGVAEPAIETEQGVSTADLADHPYLFATVTPGRASGTDAPVAFRFRLHHEDGVVESDEMTVRPHVRRVLAWDASSVDATKLASATRLDIRWYSTARPPDGGNDGAVEYEGTVVFDDVSAGDDRERAEAVRLGGQIERLQFSHGAYRETEVSLRTDYLEVGEYVFESGTSVPYTVETLSDDGVRYVLDGVTYLLGGEWA